LPGRQLTGINNIGQISGYGGAGEVQTGFILHSDGTVSTVYQPGSTGTKALEINDAGQVVGSFDGMGGRHAYVGNDVRSDDNCCADGDRYATGERKIVGAFTTGTAASRAFLDSGGVFSVIDAPGPISTTVAYAINDFDSIVGTFNSTAGEFSFLDENGVFTTLAVPGASVTPAMGTNNNGQVVRNYLDRSGVSHPFLATPLSRAGAPQRAVFAFMGLSVSALLYRRIRL